MSVPVTAATVSVSPPRSTAAARGPPRRSRWCAALTPPSRGVEAAPFEEVGHGRFVEVFDAYAYADVAEQVARVDLEYGVREELVESVMGGTVIGGAVFAALRRLAHVDASDRVFGERRDVVAG